MAKYNVSKSEAKKLGIKRVKIGSSKSSSKNKTDYSKRASGQSKREYLAEVSGGKLDYKSGKIAVPQTKTVTTPSTSNQGEIFINGQGFSVAPDKQNTFLAGKGIKKNVLTGAYEYIDTKRTFEKPDVSTKKTSSASDKYVDNRQSIDTSIPNQRQKTTRQKASDFANNAFGINTAQASGGSPSPVNSYGLDRKGTTIGPNKKKSFWERAGEIVTDPFGINPRVRAASLGMPLGQKAYNPGDSFGDIFAPSSIFGSNIKNQMAEEEANPEPYEVDPIVTATRNSTGNAYLDASNIQKNYIAKNGIIRPKSTPVGDNFTQNPFDQFQAPEETYNPAEFSTQVLDEDGNYIGPEEEEAIIPPEVTTPGQNYIGPTGRQLASGGALGNGAGLANGGSEGLDEETRDYIKRLQASLGGDFGQGDAEERLENLLNGINTRYNESNRVGENKLAKNKVSDANKLSSLFGTYNTSDSGQRIQADQRNNKDYADQLSDFLTRSTAARSGEISTTKDRGSDIFANIADNKRSATSNVADLIYKAQQDTEARNYQRNEDAYNRSYKENQDSISNRLASMKANQKDPVKPVYVGIDQNSGQRIYADPYTMQPVNTGFNTINSESETDKLLRALGLGGQVQGQGQSNRNNVTPPAGAQIKYDENGDAYYEI